MFNRLAALRACALIYVFLGGAALQAAEVRVIDDVGLEVHLAAPATRVVALAPHIVEMMYAIGAGDRLVGAVSYSNYPAAAEKIPRVGSYAAFGFESILRLQPDLVIAWASGNGRERVEPLRQLGIPVFYTEPKHLDDIASVMQRMGVLTDEPHAPVAVSAYLQRLENLRAQYADRTPVGVFYQIWNEPLRTLNGDHLLSDVIELCGGYNVFADAIAIAPEISIEAVLQRDPDVIVASGMGEARPDWLDQWQQWGQLKAVARRQLRFISPDLLQRHTPRILDGAEQLCACLQQSRDADAQVSQ